MKTIKNNPRIQSEIIKDGKVHTALIVDTGVHMAYCTEKKPLEEIHRALGSRQLIIVFNALLGVWCFKFVSRLIMLRTRELIKQQEEQAEEVS